MATKQDIRQYPLVALVEIGPANIGTGNGVTIAIPGGAIVTKVALLTATAFNSETTTTGTISDGTTTFVNAQDLKTAGAETVAVATKYYPTPATITVSAAQTGAAATAGLAFATVEYVIKGRWSENQD